MPSQPPPGDDPQPAAGGNPASGESEFSLVRLAGRDPEVTAFERELVGFFVDAAEVLGVPKSVAAIYAVCFASAEPLSFGDIVARLDMSQGSISQGVRVLKEMGALKVVGTRDRREYFAPDFELRKVVARFIEQRLEKQLAAGTRRWKAVKASVPQGQGPEVRSELETRLGYLQTWQDKGRALIPLVKAYLKLV